MVTEARRLFGNKHPAVTAAELLLKTGWEGMRVAGDLESWVVSVAKGELTVSIMSGHPGVVINLYLKGEHGDEVRLERAETPGEDVAVIEAALLAVLVPAAERLAEVEVRLWAAVDGVRS